MVERSMSVQSSESVTSGTKKTFFRSLFSRNCNSTGTAGSLKTGDVIQLDSLDGAFELTDGEKATLKELVAISVGGIIIFTYPKANTPGCTMQACLFRDSYQELRGLGFSIYGLSRDTPKSNMNFKVKNRLPYALICNQDGSLVNALGFGKPPNGITRGVIIIDKDGKVLASVAGAPDATVRTVYDLIESMGKDESPTNADLIKQAAKIGEDKMEKAKLVAAIAGHVNETTVELDKQWGYQ